jgi:4-amino-4-deoxy-L-arabinose transferase-like glycosyltransferase
MMSSIDSLLDLESPTAKKQRTDRLCMAFLMLVLALGLFVRMWKLGSWPPLQGDEAISGVYALRWVTHKSASIVGQRQYFSPAYVMLQIPFVAMYGNTLLALRLSSLLYGLLTILAAFATARRLWKQKAALVAAASAAILPLSIVMGARLGWEPSLAFPIVAWALYFAVLAWQRNSIVAAVICGAFLAIGTYAHPAAGLAISGMVVGAVLSGKVRNHYRVAVVAALMCALFSFPSVTLLQQLARNGQINVRVLTYGNHIYGNAEDTPFSPFALKVIGEDIFRTLDQYTGMLTSQYLLGPLRDPWSSPIKLSRVAVNGLWLIVLVAAYANGATGRFLVGYLIGVLAVAHFMQPGFASLPQKGRYILSVAPALPLVIALVARLPNGLAAKAAKGAGWTIFVVWISVAGVMASFIGRNVTGIPNIMVTTAGDPNKAAADFLTRHADLKRDLILCGWWSYWPLKYYVGEALPLFGSDLAWAENEAVVLPDADDVENVWWLQVADDETPPSFRAELVKLWLANNHSGRSFSIWRPHDSTTVVKNEVEQYLSRVTVRRRLLGEVD